MKKYKIAIVSTNISLDSILGAIDFEDVEICALFSEWEYLTEGCKALLQNVYQPLDMLYPNCKKCGAEYFLIDLPSQAKLDNQILSKLMSKGIPKENIIIIHYFGSVRQFNISYLLQFNYLVKNNIKIDFIVTGMSYEKFGIDLNEMNPLIGVNFSRDSQDLYYGYKMVQTYLSMLTPH